MFKKGSIITVYGKEYKVKRTRKRNLQSPTGSKHTNLIITATRENSEFEIVRYPSGDFSRPVKKY